MSNELAHHIQGGRRPWPRQQLLSRLAAQKPGSAARYSGSTAASSFAINIGLDLPRRVRLLVGRRGGRHDSTDLRSGSGKQHGRSGRCRGADREAASSAPTSLTPQVVRCTCSAPTRRRASTCSGQCATSGRRWLTSAPATVAWGRVGQLARHDGACRRHDAGHVRGPPACITSLKTPAQARRPARECLLSVRSGGW